MVRRVPAPPITLSSKQRTVLVRLKNGTHGEQHLAQRATIILLAAEGKDNALIARITGWTRNTVKKWRDRWAASVPELDQIEAERPRGVRAAVGGALADAPRSGHPSRITNLQRALILQMACEKPEKYDIPLSHWTAAALAHTAIQREIVDSIPAGKWGGI